MEKTLPAKVSSGSPVIDHLLGGGYERDIISTIYGSAGSGKTNICLCSAIATAREGKKIIYIDTEGSFSVERLKQLAADYPHILDKMVFLKPTSFEEQKKAFEKLRTLVDKHLGLVIVDSIAMLYRLELGKNEDVYETNRELGKQIAYLTELARKQKIPILITNQVYSSFDERQKINMVGGDILKYGSKCLIELQTLQNSRRRAIVRKHRSLPEGITADFKIEEKGLVAVQ